LFTVGPVILGDGAVIALSRCRVALLVDPKHTPNCPTRFQSGQHAPMPLSGQVAFASHLLPCGTSSPRLGSRVATSVCGGAVCQTSLLSFQLRNSNR
jgi:hypothetical protein